MSPSDPHKKFYFFLSSPRNPWINYFLIFLFSEVFFVLFCSFFCFFNLGVQGYTSDDDWTPWRYMLNLVCACTFFYVGDLQLSSYSQRKPWPKRSPPCQWNNPKFIKHLYDKHWMSVICLAILKNLACFREERN